MVMLRLAPLKRGFAPPGGLLPVLLIAAVLLCHGALGSAHQVSCAACELTGAPGIHHGSVSGMGEDGGQTGDNAAGGLGALSYAAVVIAACGVAFLGLLLAVRRWHELEARGSVFRWHYPPAVAHRPRGPTLPSLQVFRL